MTLRSINTIACVAAALALTAPLAGSQRALTMSSAQYGSVRSARKPLRKACAAAMASPGDYVKSLRGGLQRWTHFPLTVAFVRDRNFNSGREALTLQGFNRWVSASGSRVSYLVVSDLSSADISVTFTPDDTQGETDTDYSRGMLTHASVKIALRSSDDFTLSSDELRCLAAHEFGHALGINGHSPNASDIMYASMDENQSVSTRDLNTLDIGYGFRVTSSRL